MKRLLIFFTTIVFSLSILLTPFSSFVFASDACPESMPIQERYLCLQNELAKLEKNQGSLQKQLKNEDYQQLSLKEKISYISTQISQTEGVIDTLHMEILTQDIEINLLSKEIQEKEDSLSILKQEINTLQETVNKRVTESYKYSYVGALELIMDVKNIDSILRKTKYLIETRAKDKDSLEKFSKTKDEVEDEEKVLGEKKAELQLKRNDIEDEKERLVEEKRVLDTQKAEKDRLLAESQRREKQYQAQLEALTKIINETDNVISDVALQLFNQGLLGNGTPVIGGQTIIGYQGHTGCSFGSHLHFEIREANGTKVDPRNFFVVSGRSLSSGTYTAPYRGAYITQFYRPSNNPNHAALDMVSTSEGNQNLETYTVQSGICSAVDRLIASNGNQAYLTGEGAPLRAISSGRVYYGTYATSMPSNPSKYALVKHNDGRTSFYLHIR